MRKTIIALQGVSNTGKSTTLRLLFRRLVCSPHSNPCAIDPSFEAGKCLKIMPAAFEIGTYWDDVFDHTNRKAVKDFGVILLYKKGEHCIKIGLTSIGDKPDQIRAQLEWFISQGCELMICACHLRGGTVELLEGFRPEWEVQFIPKTVAATPGGQPAANNADATRLSQEIWRLLS